MCFAKFNVIFLESIKTKQANCKFLYIVQLNMVYLIYLYVGNKSTFDASVLINGAQRFRTCFYYVLGPAIAAFGIRFVYDPAVIQFS